jgi:hypothetical protein
MPEIPNEMKRNGRPRIKDFDPGEYLYRRVKPEDWADGDVDIEAIELPDMSVNRSSLGPPEWLRLAEERFETWAVIGFKVGEIPTNLMHLGVDIYTFAPQHIPLEDNYPHSEVRCYCNGNHINAKRNLDKALHQRWRERLLFNIRTFIRPYEPAT